MTRSSTSPRDLHEGLVKRLRAGEAISSEKIPPHRLSTAAQRLRREGVEVLQEKVILNPGGFPAQVRAVYRVPKPPSSNGNGGNGSAGSKPSKPKSTAKKASAPSVRSYNGSATADIRRRLLEGEELSAQQITDEYGIHKGNLSQTVDKLRQEGYLVTVRLEDRRAFYRSTKQPVNRARPAKPKVPKWVQEAEADEANGQIEPVIISADVPQGINEQIQKSSRVDRAPRLLSVVSKTELINGEIRLTIQDGDEFFEAVLA